MYNDVEMPCPKVCKRGRDDTYNSEGEVGNGNLLLNCRSIMYYAWPCGMHIMCSDGFLYIIDRGVIELPQPTESRCDCSQYSIVEKLKPSVKSDLARRRKIKKPKGRGIDKKGWYNFQLRSFVFTWPIMLADTSMLEVRIAVIFLQTPLLNIYHPYVVATQPKALTRTPPSNRSRG